MPNSWANSSRANRLASSTMTVRTPLLSMRSSRAAKPARVSMGPRRRRRRHRTLRRWRTRTAWRSPGWRGAGVSRCPCPCRRCYCSREHDALAAAVRAHCSVHVGERATGEADVRTLSFLLLVAGALVATVAAAQAQILEKDGSVQIAGHLMRCSETPVILDQIFPRRACSFQGKRSISTLN